MALALLTVTLALGGCLSTSDLPPTDEVGSVHVNTQVEGDKVGYHVDSSSAEGQEFVNLTLDVLHGAQGPVNVMGWDEVAPFSEEDGVSLSFNEPQNISWVDGDPPPLDGVRGIGLSIVEPTNGTSNLFLRTMDSMVFYQAPFDTEPFEDAVERVLDLIRAENEGALPHASTVVKPPNATSSDA